MFTNTFTVPSTKPSLSVESFAHFPFNLSHHSLRDYFILQTFRCLHRQTMLIRSKRKVGSDMNWWLENVLFSLVTFSCALLLSQVAAQTYCEDKPKILFYRRGQAALVSGGDTNEKINHVVVSNVNKEFLACVSSRNVEWTYNGEGEPSKLQESSTVDIQKYDDGSISYCLTSQITFSNKQSDTELSRHTGSYSCREIGNISNSVSVYVFASRKNSPTFLQSRKTITLPLSYENITNYPVSTFQHPTTGKAAGVGTNNDSTIPTHVFTIPCVTTHPNVTVKLLKRDKSKFSVYGRGVLFDPKLGFLVNVTGRSSEQLAEFYGDYKCVSTSSRKGRSLIGGEPTFNKMDVEDFVFITLIKARSFQIYPPINEVYTTGLLNLTCESEEPVIMKEVLPSSAQDVYSYLDDDDYGRDRSDDIIETTERTDQKSHIANYMEIAPAPGRSGEIQCLTEKDGKVLHTWSYRILRKRADKLSGIKFNKREKSFTCKSKLGSPGRLSFVSCRTPSECRINRICLTKSENCRGYSNSTRAFCERKSHFCGKIFYKGGSGLIRCIGEGIDEIRGFTDEASTDHAVRMGFGKLKASETALLKLSETTTTSGNVQGHLVGQLKKHQPQKGNEKVAGPSTIYEGDQVNVTLQMGYYYFLYPVQWALKFRNGSTAQISPDSQVLQVEKMSRMVHASLTLPYTSATTFLKYNASNENQNSSTGPINSPQPSEIIALHALIPLRASVDPSWKTIGLPLTVYGKKDVPQPSTDTESEELLIEQPLHLQPQSNASLFPGNADESVTPTVVKVSEEVTNENDDENDEDVDDEADEDQEQPVINFPKPSIIKEADREDPSNLTTTANKSLETKIDDKSHLINNSSAIMEQEAAITTTEHLTIESTPTVGPQVGENNSSDQFQPDMKKDYSLKDREISTNSSSPLDRDLSGSEPSTYNNLSDPITGPTRRNTKIKEAIDDSEWMIVEKNQADETLFLARSGLLFDDQDIGLRSKNIDGEKEFNSVKRDDDTTVKPELELTRSVNILADGEGDATTDNTRYMTGSETTTNSVLFLDESH